MPTADHQTTAAAAADRAEALFAAAADCGDSTAEAALLPVAFGAVAEAWRAAHQAFAERSYDRWAALGHACRAADASGQRGDSAADTVAEDAEHAPWGVVCRDHAEAWDNARESLLADD